MLKIKRLDHIQICIPKGKEPEARAFYTNILGFKEIPKPAPLLKNGGLWYELNDIQIHIGTEENFCNSKRHPAFEVKHIRKIKHYLQEKKVRFRENTAIEGIERFDFYDPFNNRIELLEKLPKSNESVKKMWNDFVAKNKEYELDSIPEHYFFCDKKKAADECAILVEEKIKTGTCGAFIEYKIEQEALPQVGELFIITDWDGNATSLIKIIDVSIRKFKDIDEIWARKEGEGDRSLAYWRQGHFAFFERLLKRYGLKPSEDILLVCEEFEKLV